MTSEEMSDKQGFEGWAILELMGHRKLGGYVKQVEMFGGAMCRLDVPETANTKPATQFYSGAAIYCVTPTTEDVAVRMAAGYQPAPVSQWELRAPRQPSPTRRVRDDDESEDDEDRDEDKEDRPF